MATLEGVNPALVNAFLQLQAGAARAGYSLGVSSGYRDTAAQAALRVSNGCRDIWNAPASSCRIPTAIPGRSNHNHGLAIDISGSKAAKAWVAANAARYGLHLPVSGEDWHIELLNTDGSFHGGHVTGATQGTLGYGFNVDFMDDEASPEAMLDQRIGGFMDAIVGAQRDASLTSPAVQDPNAPPDILSTPAIGEPTLNEAGADVLGSPVATGPADMAAPTMPGQEAAPAAAGGGGPVGQGSRWAGNVPPPGYVPAGRGVERWRDVAIAALRYTGQDPALVNILLRRMAQESGGNPTAVNNWDSNARRGDPSKGLMQNIGSAFAGRARELTNRGIYDGFANIVASIRYTLGRYGDLSRGWGRPGGY